MIFTISQGVYPSGSLVMAECNNDYVASRDQTSCIDDENDDQEGANDAASATGSLLVGRM
ncbi:hypothetical protein BM1_08175 [Bipolaris maydis]|nr:hypothetical protein BM1_08175 [Bipolaris maydis]